MFLREVLGSKGEIQGRARKLVEEIRSRYDRKAKKGTEKGHERDRNENKGGAGGMKGKQSTREPIGTTGDVGK